MITIGPVFAETGIPVVYASDAKFLPNTAVAAYSVIKHASPERRYDIILLHDGIGPEPLERFCSMSEGHENVSVRVLDVSAEFAGKDLYVSNRPGFSVVAFYRLLIPWLLPEYQRVIYLDGDTIVRSDIAELYDTDMGDSIICAAQDICGQASFYKARNFELRYRRDTLNMSDPEFYFNSGVLLYNAHQFRSEFTASFLLDTAVSFHFKSHDQDVLNRVCNGRVHWLSGRWNATEFIISKKNLPRKYCDMYYDSVLHAYIIHFASSSKPWHLPSLKYGNEFWLLAAETPFYRELVFALCVSEEGLRLGHNQNDAIVLRFRNGKIGFRYIIKSAWAWLMFKLKGIPKDEHKRKN